VPRLVNESVIDVLLLGQGDRQRQLQELPIRGDVWTEIARDTDAMHDLLITPHYDYSAAKVARILADLTKGAPVGPGARKMSYLTGIVAARLSLEDIWSVLIPMTSWWSDIAGRIDGNWPGDDFKAAIENELKALAERERADQLDEDERAALAERERSLDALPNAERQLVRLGLLIGVLRASAPPVAEATDAGDSAEGRRDASTGPDASTGSETERPDDSDLGPFGRLALPKSLRKIARDGAQALVQARGNYRFLRDEEMKDKSARAGLVWSASSNRRAEFATSRSVPAIKADAARQLFSIDCREISWAVLDSGIDGGHPAFDDRSEPVAAEEPVSKKGPKPPPRKSRVKATYDFGQIREILNSGNRFDDEARMALAASLAKATHGEADEVEKSLLSLAEAIGDEREVDWSAVEPLVKRENPDPPTHPHGTHVAGILGGHWVEPGAKGQLPTTKQMGVCPEIALYDFRVLGPDAEQTEFAIIAALQFIGYLNRRNAYPVIDGVNMSLSIAHDVRNYACGYTPVCVEAEARVAQGTVVVAAAGNHGFQQFRLANGTSFANYASSSITDPGNAEGVITVGATHRFWPHTYGVSFFSSRGPTGDGRLKPDIVAPGERIESVVPGRDVDTKDGTSMAAPHVSGAAALLMARHRELRGRPAQIKKILCETATDLGRERSFQGHGMIDVLRAIQSV
jgi:serine protease AprX